MPCDFVPLRPGHVYLSRGATVRTAAYRTSAAASPSTMLRRWLMATGYDVAFIRNVTDIDDKILTKAAKPAA